MTWDPIAIVGLGAILPGAFSLEEFWANLVARVDCSREVPAGRWVLPPEKAYGPGPDRVVSRRGCFVEPFRLDTTGLDLDWASLGELDPLYAMALQAARAAWNQGHTEGLDRSRIGVSLAAIALPTVSTSALTWELYAPLLKQRLTGSSSPRPAPRTSLFNRHVTGLPAALIARALGLGGGTLTLDAACASSLYALKLACDQLQSRRCDAMLAGGVNGADSLYTQMGFTALGALSPSGRCSPFDLRGDGLVVGEGAGVLLLKRLADAEQQGDRIHGVIRSIGLSNDIGGSLLAPDSEGQLRAMKAAYGQAGWAPDQVDLIECHGTGTPMGDRVEVNSLRSLWDGISFKPGQCPLGSVKSGIGHLLTGAGAAGMIKVLLGLNAGVLPPSVNFSQANPQVPLEGSPFRVQTQAESWPDHGRPRRAAVSAFGFGGINAHVLVEEYRPQGKLVAVAKTEPVAVAIVGVAARFGSIESARELLERVLRGESAVGPRPARRWNEPGGPGSPFGAYLDELEIPVGKFKVPPRDIPSLLPQQTLMLEVATEAAEDAGLAGNQRRERSGAIIGINLDMDTNDFHMRWALEEALPAWCAELGREPTPQLLAELREAASPALDATRTLGALGSIVASRVARELALGGPSFAISAEEASGLKALEVGVRALQNGELDTVLVGAVDLSGDPRSVLALGRQRALSPSGACHPFESRADGLVVGEGALALVLKRLDRVTSQDKVYAVIRGLGTATGGGADQLYPAAEACQAAMLRAYSEAGLEPSSVTYLEAHGSGDRLEDHLELRALLPIFGPGAAPCAVGSLQPIIGWTGACTGLASVLKAAMCLSEEMLPPLPGHTRPLVDADWGRLHFPRQASYWLRDRQEGPRRAGVTCLASDGNCTHLVLEGVERPPIMQRGGSAPPRTPWSQPAGPPEAAIFCLQGDDLWAQGPVLRRFMADHPGSLHEAARAWYQRTRGARGPRAVLVASRREGLEQALGHLDSLRTQGALHGQAGVFYNPQPLRQGQIAFVFPGSGNHFPGMGREVGLFWPQVLSRLDRESGHLRSHLEAAWTVPYRTGWPEGWEQQAEQGIAGDLHRAILGQVMYGVLLSDLARHLGVEPQAVIGYSLGESAGLLALRAWPEREEIYRRMQASQLFRSQLGGECRAARQAFGVAAGAPWVWQVVVVNRPADEVRGHLVPGSALLIVDTDRECVVGGGQREVEQVVQALGCEAFPLHGVPTVHCQALEPVEQDYYQLHLLPTQAPAGVRFYSGNWCRSYVMDSPSAARSITDQALKGLDYPKTIRQAYADGVRVFLEMGPRASCSRMINQILAGQPHLACSFSGENEALTVLKALAAVLAEEIPGIGLEALYAGPPPASRSRPANLIRIPIGGLLPRPTTTMEAENVQYTNGAAAALTAPAMLPLPEPAPAPPPPPRVVEPALRVTHELQQRILATTQATAQAHEAFLQFSRQGLESMAQAVQMQTALLTAMTGGAAVSAAPGPVARPPGGPGADLAAGRASVSVAGPAVPRPPATPPGSEGTVPPWGLVHRPEPKGPVAFTREQCLEFARGSIAKVLGPDFAPVDRHPTRVRLPDEPLMLCDRIISVEGVPRSMGPGRLVTEHDVLPGLWYLDNQRAPVCITVEAGQADLWLSAYLGIDFTHQGLRVYRLLDATVHFHRRLPTVGEVIRYDIRIDRFVRQGDTYLFFFEFDGTIDGQPMITMRSGCAGFFDKQEIAQSKGIILTEEEHKPAAGQVKGYQPLLAFEHKESYDDARVACLRQGDLAGCFGPAFAGLGLKHPPTLPSGLMKLLDRILEVDPRGGRYSLGRVRAEADVHPDDWFLTCHFVDDMVMPGTLMYECCAHTLRFLLLRMGWVGEADLVTYEPLVGVPAVLRCRGPVDVNTRKVVYEVDIKAIGYGPEPYVIADAMMYGDGKPIVRFTDMSMRFVGLSRPELEARWSAGGATPTAWGGFASCAMAGGARGAAQQTVLYDRESIMQFAYGKPSLAFGEPYQVFDEQRKIARLPRPPYAFMDRVVELNCPPWVLAPGGWIEAQYDIPPQEWYFRANRQSSMSFAVLLEIALQPCGWLAAYCGSALKSQEDLKFRNLGGTAVLHREVFPDTGTLRIRVRMTKVSEAGGMIIEDFDMQVLSGDTMLYEGTTYFGFFSASALANQVGIREAKRYQPGTAELARARSLSWPRYHPLTPEDQALDAAPAACLPGGALQMMDGVEVYVPDGGPHGLGFIRGIKEVDPSEWFFQAHFYQDPVWPGSLGLEAFQQLLKQVALERWSGLAATHRFEPITVGPKHTWSYRGQVIPSNRRVEVEAVITQVEQGPRPGLSADGFLVVDGKPIYEMKDFGLRLVPL